MAVVLCLMMHGSTCLFLRIRQHAKIEKDTQWQAIFLGEMEWEKGPTSNANVVLMGLDMGTIAKANFGRHMGTPSSLSPSLLLIDA